MSDALVSGTCKWFDAKKGFGFLQIPGGTLDIFVHADQLRKSGVTRVLNEGEKVLFCVNQGPKGQFATTISFPEDKT